MINSRTQPAWTKLRALWGYFLLHIYICTSYPYKRVCGCCM